MNGPPGDSSSRSTSSEGEDETEAEPLPVPAPAGFGNCARCAYAQTGSAAICFSCAFSTFERLAPNRCDVCELPLKADGSCGNPVCSWSEEDRGFTWVWAMSMRTGGLSQAIDRYKVEGKTGWAWIFGRVLVGYLNANRDIFDRYELIISSPTFVGVEAGPSITLATSSSEPSSRMTARGRSRSE